MALEQRLTFEPDGSVVLVDTDGQVLARGALVAATPIFTGGHDGVLTLSVRFVGETVEEGRA